MFFASSAQLGPKNWGKDILMGIWRSIAVVGLLAPQTLWAEDMTEAAKTCLEIAGPADAGVPPQPVDAKTQRATLTKAAKPCSTAAAEETPSAEVLFHAAAIAQAKGQKTAVLDLLTQASEMGLGAAKTRLGDYYLFGVSGRPDMEKAVTFYKAAVEAEDAAGMTTLALLHQIGQGVPRDTAKMVELMKGAADLGYHFAQYRLAQVYLRGDGVPGGKDEALGIPDAAMAVTYFNKAADAGNLSAALELSELVTDPSVDLGQDPADVAMLIRRLARQGMPQAIQRLAVIYETGNGLERNPSAAARMYVKAMESGEVSFEELRKGAPYGWDRETALEFQKILQDRGLYRGPLDAIVGGGTAAAARGLVEG